MWTYSKKLEYPVKIARPDAAAAKVIISQLGGPDINKIQRGTGEYAQSSFSIRVTYMQFLSPVPVKSYLIRCFILKITSASPRIMRSSFPIPKNSRKMIIITTIILGTPLL